MKIRDGYKMMQTEMGLPVLVFRDKIICRIIWYPIHPVKPVGMILEYGVWSEDATPREIFEGTIFMYSALNIPLIGYARKKDNPFFERLEKLNLCRKTGVSHIVFDDEIATVWESTHARQSTRSDDAAAA